ncbi:MAG: pseudouridine synthase [Bacteroidetes bacterium]|nr:pseudouridine synthase [Bacteroidota bacterium]
MEREKRNFGSRKPEIGRAPFKKREGFGRNEESNDSRTRRPRVEAGARRGEGRGESRGERSFSAPRRDGDRPSRSFGSSDERPRRDFGSSDRPSRSFGEGRSESRGERSFSAPRRDFGSSERPSRSFGENREGGEGRGESRGERSFSAPRRDGDRPSRSFGSSDRPSRSFGEGRSENRGERSFSAPRRDDDRPRRSFGSSEDRPKRDFGSSDRPSRSFGEGRGDSRGERSFSAPRRDGDRPSRSFGSNDRPRRDFGSSDRPRRSFGDRDNRSSGGFDRTRRDGDYFEVSGPVSRFNQPEVESDGLIRLNKYISNSGICSRREADVLIGAGAVTVNGKIVAEMGYKVSPDDIIVYGGERLVNEKKKYLLLNKPKGYISTFDDPQNRKTVMQLINGACKERLYPVGRLDRNTTGLLLFTNDGDMTKKLTHPSFGARKVYHVELDKAVTNADLQQLMSGVELEDGVTVADDVQYAGDGSDKKVVGIELHSGKNRIVRRLFEKLGYEVMKLDRVIFAGLTKKDLPRGNYRFLSEKEVNFLKMIKGNN